MPALPPLRSNLDDSEPESLDSADAAVTREDPLEAWAPWEPEEPADYEEAGNTGEQGPADADSWLLAAMEPHQGVGPPAACEPGPSVGLPLIGARPCANGPAIGPFGAVVRLSSGRLWPSVGLSLGMSLGSQLPAYAGVPAGLRAPTSGRR